MLKILTCLRHWMIISFQHLQLLHPCRLSLLSLYLYNKCTRIMSWLAGLSAKEDPIISCITHTHTLVFLCEQWHHSAGEKADQLNKEPINKELRLVCWGNTAAEYILGWLGHKKADKQSPLSPGKCTTLQRWARKSAATAGIDGKNA